MRGKPVWFWWLAVCAGLACIGSAAPWVTIVGDTIYGLETDGLLTLPLAGAALVLNIVHIRSGSWPRPAWHLVAILLLAATGAVIAGVRWADAGELSELGRELERVLGEGSGVRWGVVTTTLANAALAVGALLVLVRLVSEPVDATAVQRDALAEAFAGGSHESEGRVRGVDPVTGAALAGFGRRVVAGLLDVLVIATVWAATFAWAWTTEDPATEEISDAAALVVLLVFVGTTPLYQWLAIGRFGRTLGKAALGIRVLRAEDALRVSYGRALGRGLSFEVLALFAFPLFISFLWPLWDKRRQALYDKMADTIVVRDVPAAGG